MVNLLTGPKGSGKTQQMIDLANQKAKASDGNTVFMKNSHNDTYSVDFSIRAICMDDYPSVRNIEEYTSFILGMISCNHDIQNVFIDGILKQSDISLTNMPCFIESLKAISKKETVDFFVSISACKEDLKDIDMTDCQILN